MQASAFSGSVHKPKCVDCKGHGTHLIKYVIYTVGDIVCNAHRISRGNALGRRIEQITLLRYAGRVRLVQ